MSDSENDKSNTSFDMKKYMRNYIKNAKDVHCQYCGSTYKSYRKYRHEQSKKHQKNVKGGRLVMPVENDVVSKLQQQIEELKKILQKNK